jgi:hypothetical protein
MAGTRPTERDSRRLAGELHHGRRLASWRKASRQVQVEHGRCRLESSTRHHWLVVLQCVLTLTVSQAVEAGPSAESVPPVQAATGGSTAATLMPLLSGDAGLPADPDRWTCRSSRQGATRIEKNAWCQKTPDRGAPLPSVLRSPPPLSELDLKNLYDAAMQEFAESRAYLGLGWQHDVNWRFTGPYVGTIGSGENYGTHRAVRIAYSPEVIDWLCNERQDALPDGAMIVKEMATINESLGIELDDEGCMVIPGDVTPDSWTIMVKRSDQSLDGWYWLFLHEGQPPRLLERSGIPIPLEDFYFEGFPPTAPNPAWYPTGLPFNSGGPALNSYGMFCIQCHAVANSESTFVSLDNLLGKSLRYKLFNADDSSGASGLTKLHSPFFPSISKSATSVDANNSGLTAALTDASQSFRKFFDQMGEVSFTRAWELRLPGQSYDHVVAAASGPSQFLTSDQCWSCHGSHLLLAKDSNMVLTVDAAGSTKDLDLSPHGEWRASPMGLSGRDPIFFAQLQGETNHLPTPKTCIEDTCFHCHGVMGERQLAIDTHGADTEGCEQFFAIPPPAGVPVGQPFTLDMIRQWPESEKTSSQKYGALARDGVSCAVCHHIAKEDLGEEQTFTGNFLTGPADEIYGPYSKVSRVFMERALGITPKLGKQMKDADLCASCHNVLLPVFTNAGQLAGYSYEQATHLEWTNSDYAPGRPLSRTCQDCHMPQDYEGEDLTFRTANVESNLFPLTTERIANKKIRLPERHHYSRHSLHGLNLFFNQIAQQFPLLLGIGQSGTNPLANQSLATAQDSMVSMAQNQTALVAIAALETMPDGVRVRAKVTNETGHNLPSGVGFRRMFLELLVVAGDGTVLWASGRTNDVGAIVKGTTNEVLHSEQPLEFPDEPIQPHYQTIVGEDQVQIYQELYRDSAGRLTTSFLRRFKAVKDNRIRPQGYDPNQFRRSTSPYIAALAETVGEAKLDPYYVDPKLTGADEIEYHIKLEPAKLAQVDHVKLTLYSQSIPPFYLQERFADAGRGITEKDQIERLFYMGSHLNVGGATDDEGRAVLADWKLFVVSAERSLHSSQP